MFRIEMNKALKIQQLYSRRIYECVCKSVFDKKLPFSAYYLTFTFLTQKMYIIVNKACLISCKHRTAQIKCKWYLFLRRKTIIINKFMYANTNTNGNTQHQTELHILNWTIFSETPFYFHRTQLKYIFVLFTVLLVHRVQPKLKEDAKNTIKYVISFYIVFILDLFA